MERVQQDPCARCLSIEVGHDAAICQGVLPFTGVATVGFYHSPPLRRLIAALKYQGITAAALSVEAVLVHAVALRPHVLPWAAEEDLFIIPMPLSDKRARERGFNQAEWVAERLRIATTSSVSIATDVVIRQKGNMAQADLEHDPLLRSANVRGQFQAVGQINRPVLLVDDVVTTGSTASEVARALLAVGSPRIYLFTLAVGK